MQEYPEEIDVNSWEEFEQQLKDLREHVNSPESAALSMLFRGQENSCWPLATTLERSNQLEMLFQDYYRLISRVKPQVESFTGNEWQIPGYPEVERLVQEYDAFSADLTFGRLPGYPYMAYLRHHGFPSPLLDWTRSSNIAAYFAFSKADDEMDDRKVSIYVFSAAASQGGGNRKPQMCRLGPYARTHRRHFLQQCEYTMCVIFKEDWRFEGYQKAFDARNKPGACWKFNIPSTERLKVLKSLDEYNLNSFSLFDSEEALMETMSLRELYFR